MTSSVYIEYIYTGERSDNIELVPSVRIFFVSPPQWCPQNILIGEARGVHCKSCDSTTSKAITEFQEFYDLVCLLVENCVKMIVWESHSDILWFLVLLLMFNYLICK